MGTGDGLVDGSVGAATRARGAGSPRPWPSTGEELRRILQSRAMCPVPLQQTQRVSLV